VRPNPRGGRFLRVGRLALRGGRHGSPPGGQGAHLEGNTEARGGRTKIASRKGRNGRKVRIGIVFELCALLRPWREAGIVSDEFYGEWFCHRPAAVRRFAHAA